ncbi:MAG TPA: efflux RND transporter periplasmic adaptor subunit [Steroidobacteraceae bacterium]|nr:efflux RND transporter periplasmic adaptor subunit [Steroidobacteraceae bacterium]
MLAACGGRAPQGGPPASPEVGVITLAAQAAELTAELPGRTSAFRLAEVRPQVDGIIRRRLFTEGAEVRAGQPLYEIDAAPYQAAVRRAEAALASAEAQLNAARLLADRYEPLQQRGVVSRQDYDNAVAGKLAGEAAVASARASLESARIDLGYTQVRAPISGRIGRSLVTEGALAKKAQDEPLATIAQLDPIYVDVTQSSAELLRLRRDLDAGRLQGAGGGKATVELVLEDGSRYAARGSLQFSEVTVDQGTGSVLLRAEFPNRERTLLPGMFVRARLELGRNPQALLVPQGAVARNARGEPTVMVVDAKGVVTEKVIQADRAVGSSWLVGSGLAAGDRVIVEGLQKARAGMTVKALPAGAAGPVAGASAGAGAGR